MVQLVLFPTEILTAAFYGEQHNRHILTQQGSRTSRKSKGASSTGDELCFFYTQTVVLILLCDGPLQHEALMLEDEVYQFGFRLWITAAQLVELVTGFIDVTVQAVNFFYSTRVTDSRESNNFHMLKNQPV